jgi:hypothetical protein
LPLEWLRAETPKMVRRLVQINEQLDSDPKNSELRKQQRELGAFLLMSDGVGR